MKLTIVKKWNWLARDEDGEWCLFEKKPIRSDRCWHSSGDIEILNYNTFNVPEGDNWKNSLYKRCEDECSWGKVVTL